MSRTGGVVRRERHGDHSGHGLQRREQAEGDVVNEHGVVAAGQVGSDKGERVASRGGDEGGGVGGKAGAAGAVGLDDRAINFDGPRLAAVAASALCGGVTQRVSFSWRETRESLGNGAEFLDKGCLGSQRRVGVVKAAAIADDARAAGAGTREGPRAAGGIVAIVAAANPGGFKAGIRDWRRHADLHIVDENGVVAAGKIGAHKGERVRRGGGGEGGTVTGVVGGSRRVGFDHAAVDDHVPRLAGLRPALRGGISDGVKCARGEAGERLRDVAGGLNKRRLHAFRGIGIGKSAAVGDDARAAGTGAGECPAAASGGCVLIGGRAQDRGFEAARHRQGQAAGFR